MAETFGHVELQTSDVGRAKTFYKGLFNWTFEDLPDMGYTLFNMGESTTGGMMKNPMPGAPSFWLPYVVVNDIKASTAKAKDLGATICQDVMEVGAYGWLSIITDPTGATLGFWKAKPQP